METRKQEASSAGIADTPPTHCALTTYPFTGIDTMKSSIVKVIAGTLLVGTATLAVLKDVPGAADTGIEQEEDQAQLRIQIDRQAVQLFGDRP